MNEKEFVKAVFVFGCVMGALTAVALFALFLQLQKRKFLKVFFRRYVQETAHTIRDDVQYIRTAIDCPPQVFLKTNIEIKHRLKTIENTVDRLLEHSNILE